MFGFLFMSIMDSHEEKLISKAAAGDGAAFSELMTMHEKRIILAVGALQGRHIPQPLSAPAVRRRNRRRSEIWGGNLFALRKQVFRRFLKYHAFQLCVCSQNSPPE